jgi:hypothetical protein
MCRSRARKASHARDRIAYRDAAAETNGSRFRASSTARARIPRSTASPGEGPSRSCKGRAPPADDVCDPSGSFAFPHSDDPAERHLGRLYVQRPCARGRRPRRSSPKGDSRPSHPTARRSRRSAPGLRRRRLAPRERAPSPHEGRSVSRRRPSPRRPRRGARAARPHRATQRLRGIARAAPQPSTGSRARRAPRGPDSPRGGSLSHRRRRRRSPPAPRPPCWTRRGSTRDRVPPDVSDPKRRALGLRRRRRPSR